MEYTKGEWRIFKFKGGSVYCIREAFAGNNIAIIPSEKDEYATNAQLIAAAPDLYEALKDALAEICRLCVRLNPQHKDCESCEDRERRCEALAKAEGK